MLYSKLNSTSAIGSIKLIQKYRWFHDVSAHYLISSTNILYGNLTITVSPTVCSGFKFRGGGYLQLTGRESYTHYAKYIGEDLDKTAELVHTTEHYALDSAAWEFCIDKKLLEHCDKHEFELITKKINGGLIGLKERQEQFNKYKQFLG